MNIGIYTGEEALRDLIRKALPSNECKELLCYSIELLLEKEISTLYLFEEMVTDKEAETLAKDSRENNFKLIMIIKSDKQERINEFIENGIYNILTGTFEIDDILNLYENNNTYQNIEELYIANKSKKKEKSYKGYAYKEK